MSDSELTRAGTWTVDYRNFPSVRPSGYDRSTDAKIYQGCTYEPSVPYGRLLGQVGADDKIFSIGTGAKFTANASSSLNARQRSGSLSCRQSRLYRGLDER
jgi:hypothetical protein